MTPSLESAYEAMEHSAGDRLTEQQALVLVKCRALMAGYHARWKNAGYVPEKVEQILTTDLYNPETGAKSRSFKVGGKLDVVARISGRRVLMDHKTTSQDIADPNASYWRQLVVEGQVSHYMLLQWMHGEKCDDAVWDVVRKPMISPKKLSAADRRAATSLGTYCGARISEQSKQAMVTEERETLEMFELRLAHDCTTERPEWYFARRSVPRMDAEILEYAGDLWEQAQDILHERKRKRLPPKNGGACMTYGTPCKFLGICSGHDTHTSERWKPKTSIYPELPGIANETDLLTNSRLRTFQTCRRKHYYEFELGVERQDEEEREALYFGTLLHAGLEAWWNSLKENLNDSDNIESPAIGAGNSTEPELAARS